jgi:hypothetical protein
MSATVSPACGGSADSGTSAPDLTDAEPTLDRETGALDDAEVEDRGLPWWTAETA